MKFCLALAAATAAVALSGASAHASSAIGLVTPGAEFSSLGARGFEFSALDHQSITALGVYDSGKDGLAGEAQVGIWDMDGNLLASATVPGGTGAVLNGRFRYVPISPLGLTIGTHYVVGAYARSDLTSSWNTGAGGSAALNLHLNYFGDRYGLSGFKFPDTTDLTTGAWLGGNFIITAAAVPEPATWALMIGGFALAGAALRRRRTACA